VKFLGPVLMLCAALGVAFPVRAQEQNFSIERLHLATDRNGLLDVEWAGIDQYPYEYDAALVLGYALNPLVLNVRSSDGTVRRVGAIVGHRVSAYALLAFTITEWLEIGGEIPLVLFQASGGPVPGFTQPALSAFGLGDARVLGKVQVLREQESFVDLSLIPALTLPTGLPQQSYLGEAFPTFTPQIAVARRLWDFRLAGTVGGVFRPSTDTLNLNVGHELTWQIAAGYQITKPLEIQASLGGATSFVRPFQQRNSDPLALLAGVSWDAWRNKLQVFGGAGVGIIAGFGVPDFRVFAGIRWAPRNKDRDGDGIEDDVDLCPDDPEDKDGFEDSDGCPENDNDGDGILDDEDRCPNNKGTKEHQGCLEDTDGDGIMDNEDKCPLEAEDDDEWQDEDGCPEPDNDDDGILDKDDKCPYDPEDKDDWEDIDGCPEEDNDGDGFTDDKDQCPNEPEDMDGDKDEDGCPDNAKIIVTKKKVFTLEKIYFDFGKASIKKDSMPIIDGVAQILSENPELGNVRIEGHTDDKGSEGFNLMLSQQRVESVRAAMMARGIPGDRLEAVGYGEAKPIDDNNTAEGREKNRRVEFVFVSAPTPAPEPAPAPAPAPAP
jgi:outer membrane protein OmpA-like peptidoglycan-associated protein